MLEYVFHLPSPKDSESFFLSFLIVSAGVFLELINCELFRQILEKKRQTDEPAVPAGAACTNLSLQFSTT